MLGVGAPLPANARVWTRPSSEPEPLRDALGDGAVLLVFYLLDWSFT